MKCTEEEICVTNDISKADCIRKENIEIFDNYHYIDKRQIKDLNSVEHANSVPCSNNECRYGECEIISLEAYKCHCEKVKKINYYILIIEK